MQWWKLGPVDVRPVGNPVDAENAATFFPTSDESRGGAQFYFDKRAKGRVPVYHVFPGGIGLHELPQEEWADLSDENIDRPRWGLTRGVPQVLFNYASTSRGPWRLKALVDREGHALTKSFVVVRPMSPELPLEFLWAVLNSPVANSYAYSHLGKRDNLEGTMRRFRVPEPSSSDVRKIADLVSQYFASTEAQEAPLFRKQHATSPQEVLLRIDAAVLDLYDLPAHLEWELLDLFADWERGGVPFRFDRFFPSTSKSQFLFGMSSPSLSIGRRRIGAAVI
jgi:hypothetical protein